MFWCSCCWLSWKQCDCTGRTFFIQLWWSIESFGISPVKLQTNAFSILMHTCAYIVMILSEERLFAERLLTSLSPWEIRPEVLFPPSTSLEWQTAFQAVREASTSPKISDNEKGKRRADWHHPGGSEYREIQTVVCSGRITRLPQSISQGSSVKSVSSASSSIIFRGLFGCTLIIMPQGRDSAVHTGHHAKDYRCSIKWGMGRVASLSFLCFLSLILSLRSVLGPLLVHSPTLLMDVSVWEEGLVG